MLTRLNVPLFLEPGTRVAQATLDHVALRDGALTFDVHNTGTVHVRLDEVVVKGLSREGTTAHEQRVPDGICCLEKPASINCRSSRTSAARSPRWW